MKLCECGCGNPVPNGERYPSGDLRKKPVRFIHGHNAAGHATHFKHGLTKTPEVRAYYSAKSRCTSPSNDNYKRYGGRGIKFLFTSVEQWLAELGSRPSPEHSVDRVDVNGNYAPGNVKWSTPSEQQSNRRPYKHSPRWFAAIAARRAAA
jgi:hypothetical protein